MNDQTIVGRCSCGGWADGQKGTHTVCQPVQDRLDALALSEARVREAADKGIKCADGHQAVEPAGGEKYYFAGGYKAALELVLKELTPPSSSVQVAQAMREVCEAAKHKKSCAWLLMRDDDPPCDCGREQRLTESLSRLEALEGKS